MSVVIKPEVGRTLYYYPHSSESIAGAPGPLAAKIVHVHSESMVNLVVFDSNGNSHGKMSVNLRQPGDGPRGGSWCEWMPWQVEQAQKTAKPVAAIRDCVTHNDKTEEVKPSDPVSGCDGGGTTTTSSPAVEPVTTTDSPAPSSWLGKK